MSSCAPANSVAAILLSDASLPGVLVDNATTWAALDTLHTLGLSGVHSLCGHAALFLIPKAS